MNSKVARTDGITSETRYELMIPRPSPLASGIAPTSSIVHTEYKSTHSIVTNANPAGLRTRKAPRQTDARQRSIIGESLTGFDSAGSWPRSSAPMNQSLCGLESLPPPICLSFIPSESCLGAEYCEPRCCAGAILQMQERLNQRNSQGACKPMSASGERSFSHQTHRRTAARRVNESRASASSICRCHRRSWRVCFDALRGSNTNETSGAVWGVGRSHRTVSGGGTKTSGPKPQMGWTSDDR